MEKTLNNTDINGASKQVSDLEIFGNGDTWQLICKASSKTEGWMKSTKALEIDGVGCLVQVTTQQKNLDGSYAIAEAINFVRGVKIVAIKDDSGAVKGRRLSKLQTHSTPQTSSTNKKNTLQISSTDKLFVTDG
jgi:hypothetical protein